MEVYAVAVKAEFLARDGTRAGVRIAASALMIVVDSLRLICRELALFWLRNCTSAFVTDARMSRPFVADRARFSSDYAFE